MDEKNKNKHWKNWKEKRTNAIMLMLYCSLFAVIGGVLLIGGLAEKEMYSLFKDDEYLTDDGLPYRDMANATYTYPAKDIDELADGANWTTALGAMVLAATAIIALSVAWIMPEKKEMHLMFCKGEGEKEYCPECGLKLSRLEEK